MLLKTLIHQNGFMITVTWKLLQVPNKGTDTAYSPRTSRDSVGGSRAPAEERPRAWIQSGTATRDGGDFNIACTHRSKTAVHANRLFSTSADQLERTSSGSRFCGRPSVRVSMSPGQTDLRISGVNLGKLDQLVHHGRAMVTKQYVARHGDYLN